ncbi:hypothetical protein GA0115236_161527 [Streptomyces sp. IgraMP-1]|nr:hypothetical protein GA0115236_161527 [Streptomyces sp. IgraMP-1]
MITFCCSAVGEGLILSRCTDKEGRRVASPRWGGARTLPRAFG